MSTPSNNQDTEKPSIFGQTNLFKSSTNPFMTKTDAPSGGLFSSATSSASQQDGNKGIFGSNTGNLFNQGNAQTTTGGLFGARPVSQKESSKQENKTSTPTTGMFSSNTAPSGGFFGKPQGEPAKQENISTPGGIFGLNKPSTQQSEAPKQETKTATPPATGMFSSNTSAPTSGGLFGLSKSQGEPTKQESTSTSGSMFGLNKSSTEATKQETKTATAPATGGIFGSTPSTSGGGIFGLNKPQGEPTKQESTPTSGSIFGLNKPAAQQEAEKQETKTNAPAPSGVFALTTNGSLFGLNKTPAQENSSNQPAAGGLFGLNKTTENKAPAATGMFGSKTEDKAEKQETKTATPPTTGIFKSFIQQENKTTAPPATGIFGSKTEDKAEKQETKTATPPATGGIFGSNASAPTSGGLFGKPQESTPTSGGIFGLNKPSTQQETKTATAPATGGIFGSTPSTSGGGIFGLNKPQGEPTKQETTPTNPPSTGTFGNSATNWPSFGAATTSQPSTTTTMFQAREAPAKKKKDEMSTLSPEKKTAPLNISNLPSAGVQSSLFTEPTKTTNLFGKASAPAAQTKEEPKKAQVLPQAPVDDSRLDAIFKSALAKEEKVTQKIKDITSKMNNAQVVDQFLKEQNQAIDEFYAEFTQNLVKKVAEIADQQKQNLKKKLADEVQEFKKTTEELSGHFNKLLAENSLATVKNQLLSAAKNKKDAEQAVKSALAQSFELENGFSPLVKKYKAIKYTIPSLGLLSKPIDRQPATKQALMQKAEVVLPELEKVIEDINLALTEAIGSLSHPLKSYLPKISKCVELENSLLGPDFPFELPGVPSEEILIPKDSKIREVVYKIHKNEAQKLRGLNVLSKDGEEELVLRVKPVSVRYDMAPGDLMLVNQIPCEIKSKNSSQQSNEIEFELENVLTGIPQNEKFHSKWDQAHELVLTESLVLVKPNNSSKGYYTLMNLKDPKSTRGLVKAIQTDRTLNDKLQRELETILTEEKRALVQVLRIKGEDIIVSCKKLRK